MNTGVQRSGATPPAARTATTKPVGVEPGNPFGQGKNAPLIAMAHEIPYVATATVAELRDLEHKVERAMELRGARYIHIFVPCPLGWGGRVERHDPDCAPRKGERAVPGVRGRARRGRERLEDPAAGAGGGVPQAPAPLRAPVRKRWAPRPGRADPGGRRPQHRAVRAAVRRRRARSAGRGLRHGRSKNGEPRIRERSTKARARPTCDASSKRRTTGAQ